MPNKRTQRLWELDALRGIAIVLMVVFHVVFNLETFFDIHCTSIHEGFWFYEGRVAAIIFIVLVGVVSSLINNREEPEVALQKNSYRGIRLIALGLLITMASYNLDSANTIWFGILHFLGLSILISIPLCRYRWLNIILGLILFAGYFPIRNLYTDNYYGLIFGIMPPNFSAFDHYALIPWLGFVLIGIALGNWIYPKGEGFIQRKPISPERKLAFIGKYSLWIYMLHQPIILSVMWLFLH